MHTVVYSAYIYAYTTISIYKFVNLLYLSSVFKCILETWRYTVDRRNRCSYRLTNAAAFIYFFVVEEQRCCQSRTSE